MPTLAGLKRGARGRGASLGQIGCCGLSPAANGRRRFASLDLKRGSKQKHATTPPRRDSTTLPGPSPSESLELSASSSSSSHAGGEGGGGGKEGKKSVAVSASGTEYAGPHDDAVDGMYQESALLIALPPLTPRPMITKRICVASCLRRPATPRSNPPSIHPFSPFPRSLDPTVAWMVNVGHIQETSSFFGGRTRTSSSRPPQNDLEPMVRGGGTA